MNWAQRRKLAYVSLVLVFFGVIGFYVIHKATSVVATCFDSKQNGDETGVDCGGGCSNYCANELSDPVVQWVRVFPVTPGIVDVVAYIRSGHQNAGARNVAYEFKLYDEQNNLLVNRTGTTFLGPSGTSAISESLVRVGNNTATLARFTFTDPIGWSKISPDFSQVVINTDRNAVTPFNDGSRLTATLQNKSRYNFFNLDVVAIVYDADGNAIASSKALLPSLSALQTTTMYFTWPYPVNNVARVEIIPRFNPFTAQSL